MREYTLLEASQKLDVTYQTIRRWIKEGKLTARREKGKYYIKERELLAYV